MASSCSLCAAGQGGCRVADVEQFHAIYHSLFVEATACRGARTCSSLPGQTSTPSAGVERGRSTRKPMSYRERRNCGQACLAAAGHAALASLPHVGHMGLSLTGRAAKLQDIPSCAQAVARLAPGPKSWNTQEATGQKETIPWHWRTLELLDAARRSGTSARPMPYLFPPIDMDKIREQHCW